MREKVHHLLLYSCKQNHRTFFQGSQVPCNVICLKIICLLCILETPKKQLVKQCSKFKEIKCFLNKDTPFPRFIVSLSILGLSNSKTDMLNPNISFDNPLISFCCTHVVHRQKDTSQGYSFAQFDGHGILATSTMKKVVLFSTVRYPNCQWSQRCWQLQEYIYISTCVLGSKLPLFSYNRGWSSTQ